MTAPEITFTIPGEPSSKDRPRFGRGHTYTTKKTQDAEARVIEAFDLAYPLAEPIGRPVRVELLFCNGNRRRRDLDNMAKLVLDALNKVAYEDDWLIADLHVRKAYDPQAPRVEVNIWEVTQ